MAVPAVSQRCLSALRLGFACESMDSQGTEIFGKRLFALEKALVKAKRNAKTCHLSVHLLLCVQTSAVLCKQIQMRLIQHADLRRMALFWNNTAVEFNTFFASVFFKEWTRIE